MRRLRLVATAVIATMLLFAPSLSTSLSVRALALAAVDERKSEVKVWVNTQSGVYHCPGTRWYGATKRGKFMGECEARKDGFRPAYGRTCGSACE